MDGDNDRHIEFQVACTRKGSEVRITVFELQDSAGGLAAPTFLAQIIGTQGGSMVTQMGLVAGFSTEALTDHQFATGPDNLGATVTSLLTRFGIDGDRAADEAARFIYNLGSQYPQLRFELGTGSYP